LPNKTFALNSFFNQKKPIKLYYEQSTPFLPFFKACSNPLLYGWLNDNFRKEFNEILSCNRANHQLTAVTIKLHSADQSFAAALKKRAQSVEEASDAGCEGLLKTHNDMQDMKSEFTL